MARTVEVMVSSRNSTPLVDGSTLTALRREVKAAVQGLLARPDGEARVSVWINEDGAAVEGSSDWYDESMARVRDAAIVPRALLGRRRLGSLGSCPGDSSRRAASGVG